ncbi:hypothetical protein ACW9ID_25090 [Pseudomonas gingeri]
MEKLHYYYFVFLDTTSSDSLQYKSGLVGLKEPKFPYPMIVAARKIAGAEPNAIMSSLSYLGEMTSEEFGKPDAARVG